MRRFGPVGCRRVLLAHEKGSEVIMKLRWSKPTTALAILAILTASVAAGSLVRPDPVTRVGKVVEVADLIAEDDPRWDCHTMGNRVCGYSTTDER